MGYFPVMLDMSRKSVALVGTGAMALEKLKVLLAADACVEVFDTVLQADVAPYIGDGVRYTPRLPHADDLRGRILVVAAHRDCAVNEAVWRLSEEAGALVNVVDVPDLCDALMVSQLRRGDLVIGISTSGRGPALARRIREALEPQFDWGWAERLAAFGEARAEVRRRLSGEARSRAMSQLADQVMVQWREALERGGDA